MAQLRWTLSLMRPYRSGLFLLGTLALLEIALSMTAPWPLKIVVDNVLAARPLPAPIAGVVDSVVGSSAFALLLVVVVSGLLLQVTSEIVSMIHTQIQIEIAQRMVYDLRARLLAHLQDAAAPSSHQAKHRRLRVPARRRRVLPNDLVMGGVFPLATAVLTLVVMFVILVRLDATLALLSLSRRAVPVRLPALLLTTHDRPGRAGEGARSRG